MEEELIITRGRRRVYGTPDQPPAKRVGIAPEPANTPMLPPIPQEVSSRITQFVEMLIFMSLLYLVVIGS